jgi:RHS repeat-associated protein
MRAALHRAAKTGNPDRARDLSDGRRRDHRAPPRSGAHASRWCVDELAERAPRPPRVRAERRARHNPSPSRARVGPSELYGYDAHGSIAFLTDATGNETDTYTYDAWGNLIGRTGSTSNTRLFAGEEVDPDLGLIDLRARQYNAGTGRFLTSDPYIGNFAVPLSFNRYLYTTEDPVNRLDPSGRSEFLEFLAVSAIASPIINGAILGTVYAISKYASDPIIRSAAANTEAIGEHLAVFVPYLPVGSVYAIGNLGACMILLEVDGYYENFNPDQPPPAPCLVTP